MALKITEVKLITNYSWTDVSQIGDWNAVKNTNTSWQTMTQTSEVGQIINIEVEVVETTWDYIKGKFGSWNDIKNNFADWLGLKNI